MACHEVFVAAAEGSFRSLAAEEPWEACDSCDCWIRASAALRCAVSRSDLEMMSSHSLSGKLSLRLCLQVRSSQLGQEDGGYRWCPEVSGVVVESAYLDRVFLLRRSRWIYGSTQTQTTTPTATTVSTATTTTTTTASMGQQSNGRKNVP